MSLALLAVAVALHPAIEHTFVYEAENGVRSVSVAGTFNDWNKDVALMRPDPDGRTWRLVKSLPPGRHLYKFVIDGTRWVVDPRARRSEDDGMGNVNSVLVLVPTDYATPAERGDGKIAASILRHRTAVPDANIDRGMVGLALRVRPGDVERVEVETEDGRRLPAAERMIDEIAAVVVARFRWDRRGSIAYAFRLQDGPLVRYFGPSGLTARPEGNRFMLDPQRFAPFEVPEWVERSVIYQIFPDRFDNGDRSNDPRDVVAWDAKPTYFNRFGGDIAGIERRRDYLKNLGIDVLYFNPVFQSPSNHRYDATDYLRIDRELGTNEDFARLTANFAREGIRTVIDGVYNHTAVDFFAFKDLREKGEASRYRNWYFVKSFPVVVKHPPNYEAWFGFESMPKVNLADPEAFGYFMAVTEFWHRNATIAGWRLDVANEVPMSFWRKHREQVKRLDPQAWIVGEMWGDATPWLGGDQWDSVMNYRFRDAVVGFVANGTMRASQFMSRLMAIHEQHAPQVSRNLMNLLGSHDTPRFRTVAAGRLDLALLAATLQFTWIGVPSVYYGDELGMEGDKDPDNRRGMRWDLADDRNEALRHYRRLIALRQASRALQSGDPVPLGADDRTRTLSFARIHADQVALVVVNRAERAQTVRVPLRGLAGRPARMVDALSGRAVATRGASADIEIGPLTAAVLVSEDVYRQAKKIFDQRQSGAPAGRKEQS